MTKSADRPGPVLPTYAELKARPGRLSGTAWGLFGADDELGTLNHLTPERVRRAAESIREGVRFGLNLPLDTFDPPLIAHRGNPEHHVFGLNEFHRDERIDGLFTQASTQVDGLRHFAHPDHGFYNDVPGDEIIAGTTALGMQNVARAGIVGRGVLVDVARFRESVGRPIDHTASEQIDVADVDAALDWQDATLESGDILLLRSGWLTRARSGAVPQGDVLRSAGLAATEATAAWLWDRRISLAAADNIALEAWPANADSVPTNAERDGHLERSSHTGMLHRILIPLLGLAIGELWDLDELAQACAARGRYDVFVTAEPLNITGGVGSPANALAII